MHDIVSTLKKKARSFLKNFFLILLLIFSFYPILQISAQVEQEAESSPEAEIIDTLGTPLMPVFHYQGLKTYEPGPMVQVTACENSDFSLASFQNWSGCSGLWCSGTGNTTRCWNTVIPSFYPPCENINQPWYNTPVGGHFSIEDPGNDPCITGLQRVFQGEAHSALIGNRQCTGNGGGYVDQVTYPIAYDPNNSFFIYRCAVVLQNITDPSHNTADKRPRFTLTIKDHITQNTIDPVCGFYDLYPGDGITTWNTQGSWVWKDWSTIGIDLNALPGLTTGQMLDVVFNVHGCGFTAHTGYAYISAFCGSMNIQNSGCEGSGSVTLTGPPGFTIYEWIGPYCPTCPPNPPTYTGNPITFTAAQGAVTGNTFVLNLTALNGCTVQNVQQIIAFTSILAGFTEDINCAERPSSFFDTSWVNQNDVTAWRWFFGDPASGANDSSHLENPTHSFTAPGIYNVKLISYSTEGCVDTIIKPVTIDTLVTITNSITRSQICSNQHTNIVLTTNLSNPLFTWTATATGSITGFSDNAVPAPSPIDHILVNNGTTVDSVTYIIYPHQGTCTGDSIVYRVVVFPNPVVTPNPVAPVICSGQTTNISLTCPVAGATFAWTAVPSSINVSGYGPGSGNVIAQTLTTPGTGPETVTYHIVPTANGCPGDTIHLTVFINPKPHLVTDPMTDTICSQASTNINLISSCPGTNFTWTATVVTGSVSGSSGGSGNSIVQTLIDNLSTPGQVNYTITPTAGTCVGNDTVFSVQVKPKPLVTNTPLSREICSDSTINIILTSDVPGSSFAWIATGSSTNVSGFLSGSGPSISQKLINTGSGPEIVTYHIAASKEGCVSDTAYLNITVHPLPVPAITGAASVCLNSSTVYGTEAGMTGYLWTVTSGGTITAGAGTNTITVNWTANGAQTITVNYIDTHGCTAPAPSTYNVNVSTLPVPGLVGSNSICIGNSAVYTTDPLMSNYVWAVSAGGTVTAGGGPTDNSVTVQWTVAGAQTVSVNYEAGPGCTSPSPTVLNLTVHPLPVPAIAGTNDLCEGSTGIVYSTAFGMTGYIWNVSAGGTVTAGGTNLDNTVTVTWHTAGAQSVSVNYTDPFSCTALAPVVYPVTVHALPVPTIAGSTGVCEGTTGTVYTTQAGQSNYLWTVSGGGTITAGGTTSDNTVTVTWNTPGPQTVTVNYHDANNCTAVSPVSYAVTVHPLPVPVLGGDNKICEGTTGAVYTTQPGMTNYLWAVSGGGTITAGSGTNAITVTWNTAGAQTVSVNFNDLNNCTAVSPTVYNVTVDPLPVPTISGNNSLCAGTTGVVYTTQAGMTNYLWTVSAGGTITTGSGTNAITVTWNTAGPQTVSVNYHDLNNCTAVNPVVFPVTVNPLPVPAIAGLAAVCEGTTGVIYSTLTGQSNYLWTVSGGGTVTAGGTTSDNTVTVTWNTAGPQTVTLNYTNPFGCTAVSATTLPVTVFPLPIPTISGSNKVCTGTAGVVYNTEPGKTNYLWTVSAGGTITSGGTTSDNTVTITWNTAGAQTVTVNYHNANNCTAFNPTVYNVTVDPLPVPTISGNNSLCTGTTGVVYTTQAGMTNYLWTVSAGGTITAGSGTNAITVTWNTPGAQSVSVNYRDANSCTAVTPAVFPVTVHPLPTPAIAGPAVLCAGSTGAVYSTQPGNSQYLWTISAGGTITAGGTATDNTVTVTWNTPGPQSVMVNYHDLNNCTALAPAVYPVTINPLPVPVVSGPAAICLNFSGTYTTAPGMTGYSWTVTAGGTITSGWGTNTITIDWTSTGLKTITLNYIDANGCTAATPSSYNVTVNTLPVPSLSGTNSICTGFSATYTTDLGMNNYTWAVSAGGTITAGGGTSDNTATILWTGTGAQTVSVNYIVGTGCTAPTPTVYNVTVNPLPTPTISGTNVMCAGPATYVYSTQPGMTVYQWTVSAGGTVTAGGSNSDNTVSVVWMTAGAQTVTVNYHDLNSCTALASTSYPVTVNPLPTPTISGAASVCLNSTSVYFTEAGMVGYIWTVSAGGTITAGTGTNSITVLWNTTGAKTIQVNYNDANGCTAPTATTFNVTVNTLPVPGLTGLNSICTGLSAVYTTDPGMNSYSWTVSAGGSIVAGGGPANNTATVLWNVAGGQTVSVNYVMGTGCTAASPTVYNVTVKPRPSITNAANSSMCSNGTTNIIPAASLPLTTFSWSATGSSGSVTGFSNGSGSVIAHTLLNSGFNIETVDYAVTPTLNGCDGPVAHYIVTVYPVADVYFSPNGQSFCSGGTTNISVLSHVAGASFTWTATGSSSNVSGFSPGSGPLIAQTLTNSGPYFESVTYHVTPNANLCVGTPSDVVVNMNPTPAVTFNMACNEVITTTDAKPITLRGGIPIGGTYSGAGVTAGIFYPSLAGIGNHTITYAYSNTYGCNVNASQNISVIGGVAFPCDNTLTDIRDNKQYPTVKLGTQCWMAKNLDYGTQIPSTAMQRDNCVIEKYCYNDIAGNCSTDGGLYQWDEVMRFRDAAALQGICPPAWHIPTENEWATLFNFYISNGFAGSPLKYTGYSGFNALLNGVRFHNSSWSFNSFAGFFWSSTAHGPVKAWAHAMNTFNPSVSYYPSNRSNAFSLRCIKD